MKYLRKALMGIALLGLAFAFFMMQMGFRTSDAATRRYFKKRGMDVEIHRIAYRSDSLRWVETGSEAPDAPLVVFVHGAPGSANNFYKYLADTALQSQARLLCLDRPGYGYSAYGKADVAIQDQAGAVMEVIQTKGSNRSVILVGHSYGGSIAAKTAMDYPKQVTALLMLAPVNDPAHEPLFWYSNFAAWKSTQWMLSPAWKVAGAEKFSHAKELQKISTGWSKLRIPVVHLHGEKDQLAPPVNADFSKRNIPAQSLRLVRMPKAGHLIPFVQYPVVQAEILRLLQQQP